MPSSRESESPKYVLSEHYTHTYVHLHTFDVLFLLDNETTRPTYI